MVRSFIRNLFKKILIIYLIRLNILRENLDIWKKCLGDELVVSTKNTMGKY